MTVRPLSEILADLPREAEQQNREKVEHPKGWEPGHEWDGTTGILTTQPLSERPKTWDDFIRDAGLDPEEVEIIGPVQVRGWDSIKREWRPDIEQFESNVVKMHYYRLTLARIGGTQLPDLPQLFKSAKSALKAKAKQTARDEQPDKVVVAVWADPQTGKTASRGGTEALIARTAETYERLGNYVADSNAPHAVWVDAGDAIESFENTSEQQHTNDLSMMSQVDVATTIEFEGMRTLYSITNSLVAVGVGSNHCRWRLGKGNLGTPADDWGLHMLRQIYRWTKTLAPEQYQNMSIILPKTHDDTLAIDVAGSVLGVAHGHQVSQPNQVPLWWARQAIGGQAVAHADILITGHFHHLRVEPVGRNPYNGKSRWWAQAPTLDNGSDWFRLIKGYDSDPGMLVFTVTKDGVDLRKGWSVL